MTGFTAVARQSPDISHPCVNCNTCSTRRACQVIELEQDLPQQSHQQLFHSRVIASGKHLFYSGDKLETLYVVKSGAFKTYITNENGVESVIYFYMPGEILGADALADHKHECSAIALGTSAVCTVPIKQLEEEVKRYSSNWLLKQACHGVTHDNLAFLINIRNNASAYSKLAYFLLNLSNQHKVRGHSEKTFRLDMRRRDLANYLGMTIETVSRTLSHLHANQTLAIRGREVTIMNFDNLIAIKEMRSLLTKQGATTLRLEKNKRHLIL